MKKVLNLYAGIGGNRKLWTDVEVTAVEIDPKIAEIYQDFFPNDEVIVADAHQYLLDHYADGWDFIWSSPPCPSHSRVRKATTHQNKPIYPDMKLYEEILFLQGYTDCFWCVENVKGWYEPLIKPFEVGAHYYWANFIIPKNTFVDNNREHDGGIEALQKLKGFDISHYHGVDKTKTLRNCVEPEHAKYIFDMAFKCKQLTFKDVTEGVVFP